MATTLLSPGGQLPKELPHARTVPSAVSPALKNIPAAMAIMFVGAGIGVS
jgi:hypothetical protein